jgi:hypothetical protein
VQTKVGRRMTLMAAAVFAMPLAVAGCPRVSAPAAGEPSGGVTVGVSPAQIKLVLAKLFPSLSDAELDGYAKNLSLDAVLALKIEIEDIRRVAKALSDELASLASSSAKQRQRDLSEHNDGFPSGLEALGSAAFYDSSAGQGRIQLSGVFSDHEPADLASAKLSVSVSGEPVAATLSCLPSTAVDIVFVVDITGSMSPVINSVRRSLSAFVRAIEARQIRGTLSVVTYQDSVGVNVGFQEPAPKSGYERSPFWKPVDIDDAPAVDELERFILRLEANSGADRPENLAGALDFARNNVIGVTRAGAANVIGDGVEDPQGVAAWPKLMNPKQVFVVFTDAPFHSDSRTSANSSLLAPFKPRPIATILKSLQQSGSVVHVSDPSWVDETLTPTGTSSEVQVDSDLWADGTGGLGGDRVVGYSLIDLDVVTVAQDTGLLDILLDAVIGSSCSADFSLPTLSAAASLELDLEISGAHFTRTLTPVKL